MNNFWKDLQIEYKRTGLPFFILAPMEDVTDIVFRGMVRKANNGMPQVLFTEFTNCDGICSVGQSRVIHRLKYDKNERPIVAQIWGKTPLNYEQTAKLCLELGFDGIDINMGCPEKSVIKQGACSALINNKPLAKEIIEACKRGTKGQIPISVKTRIGFSKIQTEEWIGFLLEQDIQALTVHARTVAGSDEPANWAEIKKSLEIRDLMKAKKSWIEQIEGLKKS
jgi:tRNA-dihydrouridine synthase